MKVVRGINPDFADFDEIDFDAEEALEEFHAGVLSYEELKAHIGPEAAQAHLEQREETVEDFFDNPEDY